MSSCLCLSLSVLFWLFYSLNSVRLTVTRLSHFCPSSKPVFVFLSFFFCLNLSSSCLSTFSLFLFWSYAFHLLLFFSHFHLSVSSRVQLSHWIIIQVPFVLRHCTQRNFSIVSAWEFFWGTGQYQWWWSEVFVNFLRAFQRHVLPHSFRTRSIVTV